MKQLIVLLLLVASVATAQNGAFTLLSACQDANGYQLSIEASHDVQRIVLAPSHGANQEWAIEGELSHHFSLGLENEWVEIRAYLADSQPIQMLDLTGLAACGENSEAPTMNRETLIEAIIALWGGVRN